MKNMESKLSNLIARHFNNAHLNIRNEKYSSYWFKGGRGSTKSSFVALEIVLAIMRDSEKGILSNCIALRRYDKYCKDSIYEQFCWAIDILKVSHLWHFGLSPLSLTFIPSNQKILFRGADKPKKIKSTKFRVGFCKYIWYEELDEFDGVEPIRVINQSLIRGGDNVIVFYTYNPPKSNNNWVNVEAKKTRKDRLIHHSTYLNVPKKWLGNQFYIEAEHLKTYNEQAYQHEYLGEQVGTGGEVFNNVTIREITTEEIENFDNIKRGIDFGYAVDPFSYGVMHYDKKRKRLYIYFEIYEVGLSNTMAIEKIKIENKGNDLIVCDSAEPKSISQFNQLGLKVAGAKKGADSIEYGIKFLQDLEEIIIDDERCPNTAKEFLSYELEKDNNDNWKSRYPDKNNHSIDMIRYALELDIRNHKQIKGKAKKVDRFLHREPKYDPFTGGNITSDYMNY